MPSRPVPPRRHVGEGYPAIKADASARRQHQLAQLEHLGRPRAVGLDELDGVVDKQPWAVPRCWR